MANLGTKLSNAPLDIADVSNLQTSLDAKAASNTAPPVGGTTGMSLTKASNTNYDYVWADVSGGATSWGNIGGTLSNQTDLQTALDAKQPLDSDLTTIAGLTATTDSFIQAKASAWAARTIAQVKTDLGLTGTNSGDQTSIVGITGTKAQFDTACTDGNFAYSGDAPSAHATSHISSGSDPLGELEPGQIGVPIDGLTSILGSDGGAVEWVHPNFYPLDTFGATTDNTNLDASTSAHGLMKKYPGGTTTFLRADGTFATPAATVTAPFTGDYATGSFTLATEKFGLQGRRLTLASTDRATLQGTSRLIISG